MSVKVIDNTPKVRLETAQQASTFLRFMADEILKLSERGTPKRSGDLRQRVLRQVLGLHGVVEWRVGYAAKQETTQYRNYTTPGTGPHYAENAVKQAVGKTAEVARKARLI